MVVVKLHAYQYYITDNETVFSQIILLDAFTIQI